MKLLSSFSLNMLDEFPASVDVDELELAEARDLLSVDLVSAVGHADTAAVFSTQLGLDVAFNRTTVVLHSGEVVVVGQYVGPRLAEGTTTLPQGATIKWLKVTVK